MNQDNNFNQNNFDSQGNNGISNNQSLNNQSFNQNMNVNQQSTPGYGQSSMQESTPQPINSFDGSNANNSSLNAKPPKKINLGLIIGIVAAVVVVGTIVVCINLGSKEFNKDSDDSTNDNSFVNNSRLENVELVMTSKNVISNYNGYYDSAINNEYFQTKNDNNEFIVIDKNANQILPISGKKLYKDSSHYYNYLGNGYFIYDTYTDDGIHTAIVVKDGKSILDLNSVIDLDAFYSPQLSINNYYKNNILYTRFDYKNIVAYDVKNKKELWRTETGHIVDIVPNDEFIRIAINVNPSGDVSGFVKDYIPNVIVDYNGNIIASARNSEAIKELGEWKYDYQIYTSKSDTYLKIKNNDYIKIFDANNNLKATISLKETDNFTYNFKKILHSGIFVVEENQKGTYKSKSILYNQKGQILFSGGIDAVSYDKIMTQTYHLSKNLDLIIGYSQENGVTKSEYMLIKDGVIAAKYENCASSSGSDSYLLCYESKMENQSQNNDYSSKLLNLKSMKEEIVPIEKTSNTKISDQSPNGEYVILTDGKKYFVYDNELNKKYESEFWITPVNDTYVISTNKYNRKENDTIEVNLINIETGKITKLDVKGEYEENNSQGLVTYDGTNYYLYRFN